MLSKSFTDGIDDKQWIGALAVGWQDDLLDAGLDYSLVEKNFISDLGFVTRVEYESTALASLFLRVLRVR